MAGETKEVDRVLSEISSFAEANGLNLFIARTENESATSKHTVLERALQKQLELLQAKVELREKMRTHAERLLAENAELKESMNSQIQKLKSLNKEENPLSPLLEKLWSEK